MTNAVDCECAAIDFEPWPKAEPGHPEIDMSDGAFRMIGATVRMACNMMTRSKVELIANVRPCPSTISRRR
jgi:hypothetical protein